MKKPFVLLITGAPGCGKGTQSELIVKKYQLEHLSTGDLLRQEVANATELGQLIESYISQGKLVPDDLIINLLSNKIDALSSVDLNGFILDGFPRTLPQAEELEKMMNQRGMPTDILIDVNVEEKELVQRLLKRGEQSGRTDDNIETIKKRLNVYYTQTQPINRHYQKISKYVKIDGMGTVEDTFGKIREKIEKVVSQK